MQIKIDMKVIVTKIALGIGNVIKPRKIIKYTNQINVISLLYFSIPNNAIISNAKPTKPI